ncbi:sam domain (sterile alpha motif) [Holotrichia oblita]|uniref:Sam domain (Sterile alpha motif) n=1 Tax=Holotrichia oblita TaxID=644536 RepID=A0ACB9TCG0_HOLOL|nr:sam domain (sterile alpha motif) [Holotrichia oblita]
MDEDNLPLNVWLQNNLQDPSIVNLEGIDEFVLVDNNVIISCIPSETDFVEEVLNQEDNDDDNKVGKEQGAAEIGTPNIILNNALDMTWPRFGSRISLKQRQQRQQPDLIAVTAESDNGRSQMKRKHIDIKQWLADLELDHYAGLFSKFEGVEDIIDFSERDIKDLGVKMSSHRARIVSSLTALKANYYGTVRRERFLRHSVAVDSRRRIEREEL